MKEELQNHNLPQAITEGVNALHTAISFFICAGGLTGQGSQSSSTSLNQAVPEDTPYNGSAPLNKRHAVAGKLVFLANAAKLSA